jgi:two-component system, chemotaxis family, protein-glutamate methylesterase/glutaminase
MTRIRVAVADDSPFVRRAIARMLETEADMAVVGAARSGEELLERLDEWAPDAVILDLSMPGLGGLATLDILMARRPTPVIILSTYSSRNAPLTLEALSRGAVDFVDKQRFSLVDFEGLRRVLGEKIRQFAGFEPPAATAAADLAHAVTPPAGPEERVVPPNIEILLLGASTGGPPALETVLRDLGPNLPVPAVVAQHMPAGFTRAFAERLDACLEVGVREASHREPLLAATVYIAPGGRHLLVERRGLGLRARITDELPNAQSAPSVDLLFRSACAAVGPRAVAVLLTGLGKDGAAGMEELARAGAYTIAQDESSSIVYGMPGAAAAAGAVREKLALDRIGHRLRELLS